MVQKRKPYVDEALLARFDLAIVGSKMGNLETGSTRVINSDVGATSFGNTRLSCLGEKHADILSLSKFGIKRASIEVEQVRFESIAPHYTRFVDKENDLCSPIGVPICLLTCRLRSGY